MLHCLPAIWSVPTSTARPEFLPVRSSNVVLPNTYNLDSFTSAFYSSINTTPPTLSYQTRNLDSRLSTSSGLLTSTYSGGYTYYSLLGNPSSTTTINYNPPIGTVLPNVDLLIAPSFLAPTVLANNVTTTGYLPVLTAGELQFYHYEDGDPSGNIQKASYDVTAVDACDISAGIRVELALYQNRAQFFTQIGFRFGIHIPYQTEGTLNTISLPIYVSYKHDLDLNQEIVFVQFNGSAIASTAIPYDLLLSEIYGTSSTTFSLVVSNTNISLRIRDHVGRVFTLVDVVNTTGLILPDNATGCGVYIDNRHVAEVGTSCPYTVTSLRVNPVLSALA